MSQFLITTERRRGHVSRTLKPEHGIKKMNALFDFQFIKQMFGCLLGKFVMGRLHFLVKIIVHGVPESILAKFIFNEAFRVALFC